MSNVLCTVMSELELLTHFLNIITRRMAFALRVTLPMTYQNQPGCGRGDNSSHETVSKAPDREFCPYIHTVLPPTGTATKEKKNIMSLCKHFEQNVPQKRFY